MDNKENFFNSSTPFTNENTIRMLPASKSTGAFNDYPTLRPTGAFNDYPTLRPTGSILDEYPMIKKVYYIPVKDHNGIPKDKSLRVVEGGGVYKKLVAYGVDFSKYVAVIEG